MNRAWYLLLLWLGVACAAWGVAQLLRFDGMFRLHTRELVGSGRAVIESGQPVVVYVNTLGQPSDFAVVSANPASRPFVWKLHLRSREWQGQFWQTSVQLEVSGPDSQQLEALIGPIASRLSEIRDHELALVSKFIREPPHSGSACDWIFLLRALVITFTQSMLYASTVPLVYLLGRSGQVRLRRRRGRCVNCGYAMRGLARCPECGQLS